MLRPPPGKGGLQSVKVCGGKLQHLEVPIAKRLETQPGLIAFSRADGASSALHGQRRSELGFHPGGDQPGLVCCIPQKLMGHHPARLMIEGFQKQAASRRSRTRSAASAPLCGDWRVVAAQKPDRSNAWVACCEVCKSLATVTPHLVISTASPCYTASSKAESWALAWATLNLRIVSLICWSYDHVILPPGECQR